MYKHETLSYISVESFGQYLCLVLAVGSFKVPRGRGYLLSVYVCYWKILIHRLGHYIHQVRKTEYGNTYPLRQHPHSRNQTQTTS